MTQVDGDEGGDALAGDDEVDAEAAYFFFDGDGAFVVVFDVEGFQFGVVAECCLDFEHADDDEELDADEEAYGEAVCHVGDGEAVA